MTIRANICVVCPWVLWPEFLLSILISLMDISFLPLLFQQVEHIDALENLSKALYFFPQIGQLVPEELI
jgi:hypothetical protein